MIDPKIDLSNQVQTYPLPWLCVPAGGDFNVVANGDTVVFCGCSKSDAEEVIRLAEQALEHDIVTLVMTLPEWLKEGFVPPPLRQRFPLQLLFHFIQAVPR